MKTIHFSDDCEVRVQGSPWALFIYEGEFSSLEKRADWYADWNEAAKRLTESNDIDVAFYLKTVWAMAKNFDDSVPGFEEWMRPLDFSISQTAPWIVEVQAAILGELFRYEPHIDKDGDGRQDGDGQPE